MQRFPSLPLALWATLALGCAASMPGGDAASMPGGDPNGAGSFPCGAHRCGAKQLCLRLLPGAPGVPTPASQGPAPSPELYDKCADGLPPAGGYYSCGQPVDRRATCSGAAEPSALPQR